MTTSNKPRTAFWIISILALLWNLAGIGAYLGQKLMSEEAIAALSEAERAIIENTPLWHHIAFAVAVWFGTLGCILLLLRKKWAKPVFIISFIGIVLQMYYNVFESGAMDVYGPFVAVMPAMVVLIGLFLIWYSGQATKKGWLQ